MIGSTDTKRLLEKTAKFFIMGAISLGCMVFYTTQAAAQTRGVLTGNSVNVRDQASLTDSNVLFRVDTGQAVEVLGIDGDFYQVNVKDTFDVYIARQYVRLTHADGVITQNVADVYALPDELADSARIGWLSQDANIMATGVCGEWYVIDYNGETGYIEKTSADVPMGEMLSEKEPVSRMNTASQGLADDIVAYAKTFIGTPYLYGSMDPKRGFDCSGFICVVMNNFGISLNRSSSGMGNDGVYVDKNDLQKGDLVFFSTSGSKNNGVISHVGMYIGNGQMIHSSSNNNRGVVISDLSEAYYKARYVKATRVL